MPAGARTPLGRAQLLLQVVQLSLRVQQPRTHLLHLPAVPLGHAALVVAQDGDLRARAAAAGFSAQQISSIAQD
jgi:hypothetical protein